jgi:hypothetical protein
MNTPVVGVAWSQAPGHKVGSVGDVASLAVQSGRRSSICLDLQANGRILPAAAPTFPDELPREAGHGSMEGGEVARLGLVCDVSCPSQLQAIWLLPKVGFMYQLPKLQLSYLMYA